LKTHTFNKVLRGELEPQYADDKCPPVIDNGVPGPGTYDGKDGLPVPNFKISQASPLTKQYQLWQESTAVKSPVGPQTYDPSGQAEWEKGMTIGTSVRTEEKGSF
jgi:hypothetical protein